MKWQGLHSIGIFNSWLYRFFFRCLVCYIWHTDPDFQGWRVSHWVVWEKFLHGLANVRASQSICCSPPPDWTLWGYQCLDSGCCIAQSVCGPLQCCVFCRNETSCSDNKCFFWVSQREFLVPMQRVPTSPPFWHKLYLGKSACYCCGSLTGVGLQPGCDFGVLLGRIGPDFTFVGGLCYEFCSWKLDHVEQIVDHASVIDDYVWINFFDHVLENIDHENFDHV